VRRPNKRRDEQPALSGRPTRRLEWGDPHAWVVGATMLIDADYRGHRIEVNAVAADGAGTRRYASASTP
jgi:hypothetical protein